MPVSQLEQSMREVKSQINQLQTELPRQQEERASHRHQMFGTGSLAKARERIRSKTRPLVLKPIELSMQEEERLSKIFHSES